MKNCKILILVSLLLLIGFSCDKNEPTEKYPSAIGKFPNIVGRWQPGLSFADPCIDASFLIEPDGLGFYTDHGSGSASEPIHYQGASKIQDDFLVIKGRGICKVFEVIDTIGYLDNPGYCYSINDQDSIKFTGILKSDKTGYGGFPQDDKWYRFEFNW